MPANQRIGQLIFFCGKMGAGKSTLAGQMANDKAAVLISEDDWLSQLYPDQIQSIDDYKRCSDRLKPVVFSTTAQILNQGCNVVLDFPANTPVQRKWLLSICAEIGAGHACYWVDRSDEVCIKQLLHRGNPNTDTVEMFHAITKFFTEPSDQEGINTIKA